MMKKIRGFIIEGADQQGKTHLCKYIQAELGWEIKHFPPPAKDFTFFKEYILKEKMISDRNFLSEVVYSTMKGNKYRIKRLTELQLQLNRKGVVIIVLDRNNSDNLKERDELYTSDQIRTAIGLYKAKFDSILMEKYFINPEMSMNLVDILISRAR